MDPSIGKRRISAEEMAREFADARCSNCGGFKHKAADCIARKSAQTFNGARVEIKEERTWTGWKESLED